MNISKVAQNIEDVVQDCLAFGMGTAEADGVKYIAEWDENETDIIITLIQYGRTVAVLREKQAGI